MSSAWKQTLALIFAAGLPELARGQCRCHWGNVPKSHEVKPDGKIELIAPPRMTVTTNEPTGSITFDLKKNKETDLGINCMANLAGVSFEVKAQDPDTDVCESGDGRVWAKLAGRSDDQVRVEIEGPDAGVVTKIVLSQTDGKWAGSWKPDSDRPGLYKLRYKGRIQDLFMDHLDSNDRDDLDISDYNARMLVIKVELTTTKGHGLWWFNGADAVNYDESATLTAQGATMGIFRWDVTAGADEVDLNNGNGDADSITATDDNTVTIKSTGASVGTDDATVTLSYNGATICRFNVTVRTPKQEIQTGVSDENWTHEGHENGYASHHYFVIKDQFGNVLPADIEMNEHWTEDAQNDHKPPTNWTQTQPEAITLDPAAGVDHLRQCWWGTSIPNTLNPQTPLGDVKVHHWNGEHYAGSLTEGEGVRILSKKYQFYQDHGRRE